MAGWLMMAYDPGGTAAKPPGGAVPVACGDRLQDASTRVVCAGLDV
jgi:hypothetical protein